MLNGCIRIKSVIGFIFLIEYQPYTNRYIYMFDYINFIYCYKKPFSKLLIYN